MPAWAALWTTRAATGGARVRMYAGHVHSHGCYRCHQQHLGAQRQCAVGAGRNCVATRAFDYNRSAAPPTVALVASLRDHASMWSHAAPRENGQRTDARIIELNHRSELSTVPPNVGDVTTPAVNVRHGVLLRPTTVRSRGAPRDSTAGLGWTTRVPLGFFRSSASALFRGRRL